MQNDTFNIPSEETRQPGNQEGSMEVPSQANAEVNPLTTRERLGQLGLDEGLSQITRNDELKEWHESHTEGLRKVIDLGSRIDQKRDEIVENNFNLSA